MNLDKIRAGKKYVFIDCFDTIIHRRCTPEQVIDRWLADVARIYAFQYQIVKDIWKELLKNRKEFRLNCDEESFEELCDFFYQRLSVIYEIEDGKEIFYARLLQCMIQIENSVQYLDETIMEFLKEASQKKLKVYCISDFYLPCCAFENFFEHLKIRQYFQGIYVSSDIGLRKSTGRLYEYVLKDLQCHSQECCMIGDNSNSDYKIPKSKGIVSYLYKSKISIEKKDTTYEYFAKILEEYGVSDCPYLQFVFPLYVFCEKLYEKLFEEEFEVVYFFSREGEVLKRLFDTYQKENKRKEIQTKYLYVSRQSTYLPSLKELKSEKFEVLKKQCTDISISDFLNNVGLYDIAKIKLQDSISENQWNVKIVDFFNSQEFHTLISDEGFINLYECERVRAKNNAIEYFKQEGICSEDRKSIAVVDIGWKGTIQDNLSKIFDDKIKMVGFYYGLLGNVILQENNKKQGLIFSDYPCRTENFNTYKINYRMLERVLYASHGSCIGYDGGKAVLDEFAVEEKELYEFVVEIQKSMLDIFSKISEFRSRFYISKNEIEECVLRLYKIFCLTVTPNYVSAFAYMNKRQKMNFGDFGKKSAKKEQILRSLKIIKRMSKLERMNKLLFLLVKIRLYPVAFFLEKILQNKVLKQ